MLYLHCTNCCIAPIYRYLETGNNQKKGRMGQMKNPLRILSLKYTRWQKYQRALNELELMSDRDLADLGFSRYDIKRIARDAAGY